jgi:uncharacterized repeat protein (TIGR03803 family)
MPMFARSLLAVVVLVAGASVNSAGAADWDAKALFSFRSEGAQAALGQTPRLGVLPDGAAIYGSTSVGGDHGGGVIYRRRGTKTVALFSFRNGDTAGCGYNPSAALIRDNGVIYGTTFSGGRGGQGVVFSLTANTTDPTKPWICTPLHSFSKTDQKGYHPFGGLVLNGGALYGTTQNGGQFGGGVVFKVKSSLPESYRVLHSFAKSGDKFKEGYTPAGSLVMFGGKFYGTTFFGGKSVKGGVIYEIGPTGGATFKVLHSFTSAPQHAEGGYQPTQGPLLVDGAGNLYGATLLGGCLADGTANQTCANPNDTPATVPGGVVFRLNPTNGVFKVLHTFETNPDAPGVIEGYGPFGGLIMDGNALFGVTQFGGNSGGGVAFKLLTTGKYAVIRNFSTDDSLSGLGFMPSGGLSMDNNGNLYGTTYYGGTDNVGVIFELLPP